MPQFEQKDLNFPVSDNLKSLTNDALFHYKRWISTKLDYHLKENTRLKKEIKTIAKTDAKIHFEQCIKQKGVWESLNSVFNLNFKAKGSCDYSELDPNQLNQFFLLTCRFL